MSTKDYASLILIPDFEGRLEFLKLQSHVGQETFGYMRGLNQRFYKSSSWLRVRDLVITRDRGLDLGIESRPIVGKIIVHHIVPIKPEDFNSEEGFLRCLNTKGLISTSLETHNYIHFGFRSSREVVERRPNDTILW